MSNYLLALPKVIYDKSYDFYYNKVDRKFKRIYPDNSYLEQYSTFVYPPTEIIDNIYLGSAFNAACFYQLKTLNIGLILNVTKEITNYYPDEFVYHKFRIYDDNKENINSYLDDAYQTIIKYQSKCKKNIFIHCFMGASRSASIMIYYLMKKHKMKLEDALTFLKTKRDIINLSESLLMELKNLE